jgi:hypothetical protein
MCITFGIANAKQPGKTGQYDNIQKHWKNEQMEAAAEGLE